MMSHPLRAFIEAKANRSLGLRVIAKIDEDGNKVFLCGCVWVEEREAAMHYQNPRQPPPPGAHYELA